MFCGAKPHSACLTMHLAYLLTFYFGFTIGAIQQKIECFDRLNGEGVPATYTDAIKNLGDYSFNEKITSCCATGSWILYADSYYNNRDASAPSYWIYGENNCKNVPDWFDNQASSLRFAGSKADWCFDSINLYYGPNFSGNRSEWFFKDKSSLGRMRAQSLIVNGDSPWTLYQLENYQGRSVCVYPSRSVTGACQPAFYKYYYAVVGSIRKGCFPRINLE